MFRSLVTLLRGAAHDADEAFDDARGSPAEGGLTTIVAFTRAPA